MKALLLTYLLGFFSFVAQGTDSKILDYRFALKYQESESKEMDTYYAKFLVKKSNVMDLGKNFIVSKLILHNGDHKNWSSDKGDVIEDPLDLEDLEKVFFFLKEFKSATVETIDRAKICKMMPTPDKEVDHLYVSKGVLTLKKPNDQVVLISGPQGCWEDSIIRPRERFDQIAAEELKIFLKSRARAVLSGQNI